ncbi:MAG: ribonuclease III [SAR202 cluster bacterium]|nr:ribonuclease III [SAR202 cluster bacterium]
MTARRRRARAKAEPTNEIEQALGVAFKDKRLPRQALIHKSYLNERPGEQIESYERLEYLGDAFLGWVVADELYRRFPAFGEGDLTRARAALVQGGALAKIARDLRIGERLVLGQGEESSGGRMRQSNLAAAVEALLGAVLLDRGPAVARRLVLRWLAEHMAALGDAGAPRDAKSALQEHTQRAGMQLPVYEVLDERGPSHDREFTVRVLVDGRPLGQGTGRRKSAAEQAAAAAALKRLED